jgi:hypothetical protein
LANLACLVAQDKPQQYLCSFARSILVVVVVLQPRHQRSQPLRRNLELLLAADDAHDKVLSCVIQDNSASTGSFWRSLAIYAPMSGQSRVETEPRFGKSIETSGNPFAHLPLLHSSSGCAPKRPSLHFASTASRYSLSSSRTGCMAFLGFKNLRSKHEQRVDLTEEREIAHNKKTAKYLYNY